MRASLVFRNQYFMEFTLYRLCLFAFLPPRGSPSLGLLETPQETPQRHDALTKGRGTPGAGLGIVWVSPHPCKCLKARGPPPQGSCLLLRHSSIYHFGPSDSHQLGQIILVSRVLGPSSLFLKIPALIVCLWTFSLIVQNVLKSPSNAILSSCLHLTVQPYNMKNLLTPYRSTELRTPSCKVKTNKQTKITQ